VHVHHQSRFLDLQALSALTHLRFTTRRRIDGQSGQHPEKFPIRFHQQTRKLIPYLLEQAVFSG